MTYEIEWRHKAYKQLVKLQTQDRRKIYAEVQKLRNSDTWGDVKRLKEHQYQFRLRIGRYRVLFDKEDKIKIVFIEEIRKRDSQTY